MKTQYPCPNYIIIYNSGDDSFFLPERWGLEGVDMKCRETIKVPPPIPVGVFVLTAFYISVRISNT